MNILDSCHAWGQVFISFSFVTVEDINLLTNQGLTSEE